MFTISSLLVFLGAAILLILVPGPDLIFAVTQGMTNGKRAGVLTAAGLSLGNIVHTLAAALGLSLIVQSNPVIFNIFKICGAVYLLVLAFKSFKYRKSEIGTLRNEGKNEKRLILKGFIMNVLNPKVAVFFLAFLPQFVNYEYGHAGFQLIMLGVIFMALSGLAFGILAYYAGSFSERLLGNSRFSEGMNIAGAVIFFILGLNLLFTDI